DIGVRILFRKPTYFKQISNKTYVGFYLTNVGKNETCCIEKTTLSFQNPTIFRPTEYYLIKKQ
nr:hypothetical protein [Ignavibacteria bacterium]